MARIVIDRSNRLLRHGRKSAVLDSRILLERCWCCGRSDGRPFPDDGTVGDMTKRHETAIAPMWAQCRGLADKKGLFRPYVWSSAPYLGLMLTCCGRLLFPPRAGGPPPPKTKTIELRRQREDWAIHYLLFAYPLWPLRLVPSSGVRMNNWLLVSKEGRVSEKQPPNLHQAMDTYPTRGSIPTGTRPQLRVGPIAGVAREPVSFCFTKSTV